MRASIGALLGSALLSTPARAQGTSTDQSVANSLLAVALPSPTGPVWIPRGVALTSNGARYDLAWGRTSRRSPTGRHETLVLGVRHESVQHDTGRVAGFTAHGGARAGIRAHDGHPTSVSAMEFYGGVQSYGFNGAPYAPDVGVDLAIGWGGIGEKARSSLGLRFPVTFVARGGGARFTLFGAPTLAWGTIHTVACDNTRADDNCVFYDKNLAFGRPRYIMSGGVSAASERARVSISAGMQHISVPGEIRRFWVAATASP